MDDSYIKKAAQWLLAEKYNSRVCIEYKKDLRRLKKGEPVDYLIGFCEFLGCRIDLSRRPFIPRPETEYWTQKAIEEIKNKAEKNRNKLFCIADVFSGSGCMGIALLKHLPRCRVDFIDIEEKFLKQAKINCLLNKIPLSKTKFISSDIFQNIGQKYDFVLANPPYCIKGKKRVALSVKRFEPPGAIFGGGKEGIDTIKRFLAEARGHIRKGGVIYFEFDDIQKEAVKKILTSLYRKSEIFKDQFGLWRWAKIYG